MQREEISFWKKVVHGWLHNLERSRLPTVWWAGGFSNPATNSKSTAPRAAIFPDLLGKTCLPIPSYLDHTITSPDAMCSGKRANIFQHKLRDTKRKRPSHPGALCPQSLPILTNTLSIPALRILSNERTVNTNPAVLLRPLPSTLYW